VDPGAVTQDHYMLVKVCLAQGDLEAARAYARRWTTRRNETRARVNVIPAYFAFARVAIRAWSPSPTVVMATPNRYSWQPSNA